MFMSKSKLVEQIVDINPSASVDYLMGFDTVSLRAYFDRLQLTHERGSGSRWIRPKGAASVTDSALAGGVPARVA